MSTESAANLIRVRKENPEPVQTTRQEKKWNSRITRPFRGQPQQDSPNEAHILPPMLRTNFGSGATRTGISDPERGDPKSSTERQKREAELPANEAQLSNETYHRMSRILEDHVTAVQKILNENPAAVPDEDMALLQIITKGKTDISGVELNQAIAEGLKDPKIWEHSKNRIKTVVTLEEITLGAYASAEAAQSPQTKLDRDIVLTTKKTGEEGFAHKRAVGHIKRNLDKVWNNAGKQALTALASTTLYNQMIAAGHSPQAALTLASVPVIGGLIRSSSKSGEVDGLVLKKYGEIFTAIQDDPKTSAYVRDITGGKIDPEDFTIVDGIVQQKPIEEHTPTSLDIEAVIQGVREKQDLLARIDRELGIKEGSSPLDRLVRMDQARKKRQAGAKPELKGKMVSRVGKFVEQVGADSRLGKGAIKLASYGLIAKDDITNLGQNVRDAQLGISADTGAGAESASEDLLHTENLNPNVSADNFAERVQKALREADTPLSIDNTLAQNTVILLEAMKTAELKGMQDDLEEILRNPEGARQPINDLKEKLDARQNDAGRVVAKKQEATRKQAEQLQKDCQELRGEQGTLDEYRSTVGAFYAAETAIQRELDYVVKRGNQAPFRSIEEAQAALLRLKEGDKDTTPVSIDGRKIKSLEGQRDDANEAYKQALKELDTDPKYNWTDSDESTLTELPPPLDDGATKEQKAEHAKKVNTANKKREEEERARKEARDEKRLRRKEKEQQLAEEKTRALQDVDLRSKALIDAQLQTIELLQKNLGQAKLRFTEPHVLQAEEALKTMGSSLEELSTWDDISEEDFRTLPLEALLEKINRAQQGWNKDDNQNQENRTRVMLAMTEANARYHEKENPRTQARREQGYNLITGQGVKSYGLEDQFLRQSTVEDIKLELEQVRLINPDADLDIPSDRQIIQAVIEAHEKIFLRASLMYSTYETLQKEIAEKNKGAEKVKEELKPETVELRTVLDLAQRRDTEIIPRLSGMARDFDKYTDKTPFDKSADGRTPAEKKEKLSKGALELYQFLFDYKNGYQNNGTVRESRDEYFTRIIQTLPPKDLARWLDSSILGNTANPQTNLDHVLGTIDQGIKKGTVVMPDLRRGFAQVVDTLYTKTGRLE